MCECECIKKYYGVEILSLRRLVACDADDEPNGCGQMRKFKTPFDSSTTATTTTAAAWTATVTKEFATAIVNTVDDDDDDDGSREDPPCARVPPARGVCVHCSSGTTDGARGPRFPGTPLAGTPPPPLPAPPPTLLLHARTFPFLFSSFLSVISSPLRSEDIIQR